MGVLRLLAGGFVDLVGAALALLIIGGSLVGIAWALTSGLAAPAKVFLAIVLALIILYEFAHHIVHARGLAVARHGLAR